jgi:clan AA aspartic protease
MNGFIDGFGRALLSIRVHSVIDEQTEDVNVWIDTGFTGEFVLPRDVIEALHLPTSGSVDAVLADGSAIELNTFTCLIEWFGEEKRIEVVESEGDRALLGVGLLLGLELRANYRTMSLTLMHG